MQTQSTLSPSFNNRAGYGKTLLYADTFCSLALDAALENIPPKNSNTNNNNNDW